MIPSRWPRALWWLLFIPAFVMVATPVALLGRGGSLGVSLTALISLIVAVPIVVYILFLRWRADARYDAVTALLPSAHVLEGIACDPTTAGLFGVGGANASTQAKRGFAVAFDEEGARFYEGGRHVVEFLRLEWGQVESVGTSDGHGEEQSPGDRVGTHGCPRRRVDETPDCDQGDSGVTGFRFSSPSETNEHLKSIRSLRGASLATPRPVLRLEAPTEEETTGCATPTRSGHEFRRDVTIRRNRRPFRANRSPCDASIRHPDVDAHLGRAQHVFPAVHPRWNRRDYSRQDDRDLHPHARVRRTACRLHPVP